MKYTFHFILYIYIIYINIQKNDTAAKQQASGVAKFLYLTKQLPFKTSSTDRSYKCLCFRYNQYLQNTWNLCYRQSLSVGGYVIALFTTFKKMHKARLPLQPPSKKSYQKDLNKAAVCPLGSLQRYSPRRVSFGDFLPLPLHSKGEWRVVKFELPCFCQRESPP